MAHIVIDQQGNIGVTMDDGASVQVRPGWETIECYRGPDGKVRVEVITYPRGREDWFPPYRAELVDGQVGGLADGRTATPSDGCSCTRHGQELHFRS